jgi:L-ascorbate metabolism protein UlaG (beta-lactamase superfamily)
VRTAILLVTLTLAALEPQPPALLITFIGNEAIQISDGRRTLVSDFPYQSGYSGYMTYDRAKVTFDREVVALITHRHLDHFDPTGPRGSGWQVVGPREAVQNLPDGKPVSEGVMTIGDIRIQPMRTPHANVEHYSYRVEWHGASFYFPGDTEDPKTLIEQRGLDIAFVTPWLWRQVRSSGVRIDAKQIVIYHHEAGETIAGCTGACKAPAQGESWRISK